MKKISVVIPARNEEATIAYVLEQVRIQLDLCKNMGFVGEVIVVLDHCTDNTEYIAKEKQALVFYNADRPGKGNALKRGFSEAQGDIVIMLDADGSHNASELPLFIDAIERGAYLVVGSRAKGGSDEYEAIRLFGNALLNLIANLLFGCHTTDCLNGYKAFRKELFEKNKIRSSGFEIEVELLYLAASNHFLIAEVPSHERSRMGGEMKSRTIKDGLRFLIAILKWGIRCRMINFFKFYEKKR